MMIESEWEDLQQKNSPHDIFIYFAHSFQLNLDITSLLFNYGKLKVVRCKEKPSHYKNCNDSRFSITALWVRGVAGVKGTVIFLAKGTLVHPRLRITCFNDCIY